MGNARQIQLTPELYAQVGAYEQNPSNLEHGNGFKLSGSGTKGAVLPVELVWSPKVNGLPGEYRAGYYYSTADASDVYKDNNGQRRPLQRRCLPHAISKHGLWLVAQQQLTSHNGDAIPRSEHVRQRHVARQEHQLHRQLRRSAFVYKGPFDARPKDDIGIGVAVSTSTLRAEKRRLVNQANGV